ncbi:MAG: hypothetical protein Q9226_009078 [Calogaya cf. arnoldii]
MISLSIVACCQAKLTGRATFFLTRSLLGIIEGGFIPDVILYLSYFYKSKELPIRLSFFWGAYGFTFIISAFLAFSILHLRGHKGLAGWQWLFALEGGLTALFGTFSSVHKALSSAIPLSDGKLVPGQAVNPKLLWQALKDYDMWPIYLFGFTWTIPHSCATAYLTLVLRGLKFDTFETNLLTVPAYILFIAQLIFWTWLSEKINNRYLIILFCQIYMLPILVALETLPAGVYRDHDKPLDRTGNKVFIGLVAYNIVLIISSKIYYMTRNAQRERIWQGMSEGEKARGRRIVGIRGE